MGHRSEDLTVRRPSQEIAGLYSCSLGRPVGRGSVLRKALGGLIFIYVLLAAFIMLLWKYVILARCAATLHQTREPSQGTCYGPPRRKDSTLMALSVTRTSLTASSALGSEVVIPSLQ